MVVFSAGHGIAAIRVRTVSFSLISLVAVQGKTHEPKENKIGHCLSTLQFTKSLNVEIKRLFDFHQFFSCKNFHARQLLRCLVKSCQKFYSLQEFLFD